MTSPTPTINLNNAIRIVKAAKESGIVFFWEDEKIKLKIPDNRTIDPGLLQEIRTYRADIMALLRNSREEELSTNGHLAADRGHLTLFPLSFGQERLWFIDQLQGTTEYHIPALLELEGHVDIDALTTALRTIVERHEVLRTVIVNIDGIPYQQVMPAGSWQLTQTTLDSNQDLDTELEVITSAPFRLDTDPMLRAHLLCLPGSRYLLAIVLHHIAADGWSMSILLNEFTELYTSLSAKRTPRLASIDLQYIDYTLWQREHIREDVLERQLAYWQDKLSDPEPLVLPADRPRTPEPSTLGAVHTFSIPAGISEQLRHQANEQGVTMFMNLAAALNILLSRYSGQQNISIGTPVAGRSHHQLQQLIGFFVNTLVLRTDVQNELTYARFLGEVKKTVLEAFNHQDLPFEKLVTTLVKERNTGINPLFQVMLVLQNEHDGAPLDRHLLGDDITLQVRPSRLTRTKFDLVFAVREQKDGLKIGITYSTALFDEETIAGMGRSFRQLLISLAENPSIPIGELSIVPPEELGLLERINDTAIDYGVADTLPELFARSWPTHYDRTAIETEEGALTYRDLDERSAALARILKAKGIAADSLVPICFERGLGMIIAITAVLRAGGAYVPIDPTYPQERIRYILSDTKASLVLTQQAWAAELEAAGATDILLLDDEGYGIDNTSAETSLHLPSGRDLAYIIYTSGSTGQPKGVMIEHAGLLNRLLWMQQQYALSPGEGVLQKTTYCFDVSVWELLWPLLCGGRLVFARPGAQADGLYLRRVMDERHIAVVHFVPSMLDAFLSVITPGDCPSLRQVVCSGEALSSALAAVCRQRLPQAKLDNLYGPTEASIDVSWWRLPETWQPQQPVLIGWPVANTALHVLSSVGALTPVGGVGELYLEGVQLARGYWGKEALSNEKFIVPITGPLQGGRLYRTGDLVRRHRDGALEYLGRMDAQVKVRGYRIEPGEIESCLRGVKGVSSAQVLATSGGSLQAYVQVEDNYPLLKKYIQLWRQEGHAPEGLQQLPNGLPILHAGGASEAGFLYEEVFAQSSYLRYGITLKPGACVVDVGANSGFFSVQTHLLSPGARVYSFEPVPPVYAQLARNRYLYGIHGDAYALALSDRTGEVEISYYPHLSIVSGMDSDEAAVREVVRAYVTHSNDVSGLTAEEVEELLDARLERVSVTVPTKRLSDVIRGENIGFIDVLKVDVENAEWLVLQGIDQEHWQQIGSVVIEVHDVDGRVTAVVKLLEENGFSVSVVKEDALAGDHLLYNVYGIKEKIQNDPQQAVSFDEIYGRWAEGWLSPEELVKRMREAVRAHLPAYMEPSSIILIDQLPLTANGKLDRKALLALGAGESGSKTGYVAAKDEYESGLVKIWEELLGVSPIGVEDNFFERGGHSLLAMRVVAAVRSTLGIEVSIRDLFAYPTIRTLTTMLMGAPREGLVLPPITAKPESTGNLPLSYSQERLWFIDHLQGSRDYHIPAVVKLNGNVSVEALQWALQQVINRHSVLRSVIVEKEGEGYQQLLPENSWTLHYQQGLSKEEAAALIDHIISQPFDLSKDHPVRALLVSQSEDEHVLVVVLHHIASDGWSMGILVREFISLYSSRLQSSPIEFRPLPVQYSDFARWQRTYVADDFLEGQLAYWKEQLQNPTVLELPQDKGRTGTPAASGGHYSFELPQELVESLNAFCRQQGVTLFMALLSLFKVLLYKYSGQDDICVGTPVAGRRQQEVENLVGFFVNTLVLRSHIDGEESFTSFLKKVKETTLEGYAHQDAPFEKVVEAVVRERDLGRNPLFQVMLVLQNNEELNLHAHSLGEDVTLQLQSSTNQSTKFDLVYTVVPHEGGLRISTAYRADLFSERLMQQMATHFTQLLSSALAAPAAAIGKLPMLSSDEEQHLLRQLQGTKRSYTGATTIVEGFVQQAAATPEAIALTSDKQQLTYKELDQRSASLAHRLRQRGVEAGQHIALCLERNTDMIVGMLGILRAGAAYVPIDPDYPSERIHYIMSDAGAPLVLADAHTAALLPTGTPMLLLQEAIDTNTDLTPIYNPAAVACIIYTSGSTGQPKGVPITHEAIMNRLNWMWSEYPFAPGERMALKTSVGFVDHIWEVFGPLLRGTTGVLFTREEVTNVDAFIDKLDATAISRLVLVPSLLQFLLERLEERNQRLPHLLHWTCSGEELPASLVQRFYALFPGTCRLLNIYGSSEVMADVTCYDASPRRNLLPSSPASLFDLSYRSEIETLISNFEERREIIRNENPWLIPDSYLDTSAEQTNAEEYFSFLRDDLLPHVVQVGRSGFVGHMTGRIPKFLQELNALMVVMNQNLVKIETSLAASFIERQVTGIFHRAIFHQPEEFYRTHLSNKSSCLGLMTGGGTLSNITALSYALNNCLPADGAFGGHTEEGLLPALEHYGYKRVVVICSRLTHYSIGKAMRILGLGKSGSIIFEFDRHDPDGSRERLARQVETLRAEGALVLAIIGIAGSTETGSVDPLDHLGSVARRYGIHFHVDAAFGGPYIFSNRLSGLLRGIELADTVAMCGHKQFYLPQGASICIFRSPDFTANSRNTSFYQARRDSYDLGKFTLEGSRAFTALLFHGVLKIWGAEGIATVVESNYDRAQSFARKIEGHPAFQLIEEPTLNIVNYRYLPPVFRGAVTLSPADELAINDVNRRMQQRQFLGGHTFTSYTEISLDRFSARIVVLRAVVMNPDTSDQDFDEVLREQAELAEQELSGDHPTITGFRFPDVAVQEYSRMPIGRPIHNTILYVVDVSGNLCPLGVPGELLVGGVQVAKGYLNREELTAEKFIANPFNLGCGRLYRTGDLCRWLEDGNLEYIGRRDHQVKVRGYRIELGEVERVIGSFEGVSKAVVTVRGEGAAKQLAAFVVSALSLDRDALQEFLRDRLPAYMVPASLRQLEALPLNANGKLDRRALAAMAAEVQSDVRSYAAPQTEAEAALVSIWERLLKVRPVGVEDNFFELGGHSLLAMRVIAAVRNVLGVEVSVRDLFTHPTVRGLCRQLANSSPEVSMLPHIRREDHHDLAPLSYSQERLWFVDQLQGTRDYHIPSIVELRGPLSVEALEWALRQVINRHQVLRSVIVEKGGVAYQQTLPENIWQLDYREGIDENEQSLLIRQTLTAPFDLSVDHMIRALLIRREEGVYTLTVVLHHIASDGWSRDILVHEFMRFYAERMGANEAALLPLPLQYGDFARWQRSYVTGDFLDRQLAYWKEQLHNPTVLELPLDKPRPAVSSFNGGAYNFQVAPALAQQLQAFCQQQEVTLFMALLSLFKILLYKYSGQDDICVGTPVAGRRQQEVENLIGFFVNTLVLRSHIDGEETFASFLKKVKETTLEGYAHQDAPFEKIVEAVVRERDLSRNPLFQAMFVMQNTPDEHELTMPGIAIKAVSAEHYTAQFDISVSARQSSKGLWLQIEYSSDLFEATTIRRFADHYHTLLQAAISEASQKLNALPLLNSTEQEQVLQFSRGADVEASSYHTVLDGFNEQVQLRPQSTAITFQQEDWSYEELEERSNRIAFGLMQEGVQPGDLVVLCVERSALLIASLLGVLKAGAAYIPLDPAYPSERISYMLEDSQARLILTTNKSQAIIPDTSTRIVLAENLLGQDASAIVLPSLSSDSLAYLIYTSGSTGRPKGAENTHAGLLNIVLAWRRQYELNEQTVVLSLASFSFDVFTGDVFRTLFNGGRLVLTDEEGRYDLALLIDTVQAEQVTYLETTPAVAMGLLRHLEAENIALSGLRLLVVGADYFSKEDYEQMFAYCQAQNIRLLNSYGLTETAIDSCFFEGDAHSYHSVPIGRPLDGVQCYVLNEQYQPIGIGLVGELYIGGVTVGRGYHNQPQLTEARFVEVEQLGRLYRTGDLCRWLEDGNLEYIGRRDSQVKIRGYRIELSEIESVLRNQPGVVQAAVAVRGEGVGKQLVGFVSGEGIDIELALDGLREQLPAYMVPIALIEVESLPLSANGKVDRKALLALAPAGEAERTGYVAPATELEEKIVHIWEELLKVSPIGVEDNFFELGGHSLLAMRVIAAIRAGMGMEVGIRELFTYPTIRALLQHLKHQSVSPHIHSISLVQPEAREAALLPLSYSQERLWFVDQLQGTRDYHIPAVIELKGAVSVEALEWALRQVINRHQVLRSVIVEKEGDAYQQILPENIWKLDYREGIDENEQTLLIRQTLSAPFDLSADHMIRALLVKRANESYVLAVVVHHIASDGWSMDILVREFVELYTSRLLGKDSALSPLALQYSDFARWQRTYVAGDFLEQQLAYWKEQLHNPTVLELPLDKPRPAVSSFNGGAYNFQVPSALVQQLQAFCQQQEVTLFMALLSLFKVLLYKYSGQDDICVGTPVAGRRQQEVESLIGFFVNTLVLRSHIDGEETFASFLKKVKDTTLEGYAHQDAPFEKVVEAVVRERDLSRNPLFQAMFVMQNTPDEHELTMPGIAIKAISAEHYTAQFDISVSARQSSKGLWLQIEYSSDLFEASTIRRFADHYLNLLQAAISEATQKLNALPLLNSTEQEQVLQFSRGADVEASSYHTVLDGFKEKVQLRPQATALTFQQEGWSYEELEERSNHIAFGLIQEGVQPGDLVVLCIERSALLIASLLGVLKAGAAYIPLDPAYPSERISYMLEDSGNGVVLTTASARKALSQTGKTIIEAENLLQTKAVEILPSISGQDLAYIIYTSGSTGRPKGVENTHAGLLNMGFAWRSQYELNEQTVVLSLASFSFDVFTGDVFRTLFNGGRLVLTSEDERYDLAHTAQVMRDKAITFLETVPAVAISLLRHFEAEEIELPALRLLVVGSDHFTRTDHAALFQYCRRQGIRLVNSYGLTEATIDSCFFEGDASRYYTVPIGRPMDGVCCYVLDEGYRPVGIGLIGELYIGGITVSQGYHNQPQLTEARFIEVEQLGRLYRTGDLCRWLEDGNLEYIGRRDSQVKIRGHRIELNEVEEAVQGVVPGAHVAVVVQGESENKRLIAFVAGSSLPDQAYLMEKLRDRLPAYMIPAAIVELETLPLNANGKIDRKALLFAVPEKALTKNYVAPRTHAEQVIAGIWEGLLKVNPIGVDDNFFELGGHSLLAMRVIAAIRNVLAVEVSVRHLFTHPTVGALALELGNLGDGAMLLPSIRPVANISDLLPLSYSQERLWFVDQLQGTRDYHIPAIIELSGAVSVEALEWALRQVINRHQVLRSVIVEKEGAAYQQILPENIWKLDYREGIDENDQASLIRQTLAAPFDLSADHMMRALLIRKEEDVYLLVVVLHHIASDGWSQDILVREFVELYSGRLLGNDNALSPLALQYSDFAHWQRTYVAGDFLEQQLAYWKEQLHHPTVLELPLDKLRPAVSSFNGGAYNFQVPSAIVQQLQAFCQQQEVTLFMALLSLFKVLLYKYSGQEDICVGTPVAGRRQQEVENLIGFFVNTLVLRSHIDGEETFGSFLKKVKETTLEGYAHQDAPFEKVVEAVVRERDLSRNPLFQAMFVMQNTPEEHELTMLGIAIKAVAAEHYTAQFDISVSARQSSKGLWLQIEYSSDLFEASTIRRFADHYLNLLQAAINEATQKLNALPLLSSSEQEQVLQFSRGTSVNNNTYQSVLDGFREQVQLRPQATALTFQQEEWSYEELEERSNRIASGLVQKGVKPGDVVVLCIERSALLIASLLGVLKAGAAYIPLDPAYPSERISYMLEDSGNGVVLTTASARKALPQTEKTIIEAEKLLHTQAVEILPSISGQYSAYIIYTSGSTGRPKGAENTHAGLLNMAFAWRRQYELSEQTVALSLASFSFDVFTGDVFRTLFNGGRLVLTDEEGRYDLALLIDAVQAERVTYLETTPAVAMGLLRHLEAEGIALSGLRLLVVGADYFSKEDYEQMFAYCEAQNIRLLNSYGLTETAIDSCFFEGDASRYHTVPIGRPLDGVQCYVLDEQYQPVGIGLVGELYIGGVTVGRGYHNQPQLTQARFIEVEQLGRLYRTGDLCRWLEDGNLEYIGRRDSQVKIRGYRIELSEIESVLRNQPGVVQAAVAVRGEGVGKQLVGFVSGESIDTELALDGLREQLPAYMVPVALIEVEALPLSANGKVDRKTLLALAPRGESERKGYVAPETELEEKIVQIWEELLKVHPIGIEDNFFELGGHSLLAMRVIAAVHRAFGVKMPIRDFFQLGTVHLMSTYVKLHTDTDEDEEYDVIKL